MRNDGRLLSMVVPVMNEEDVVRDTYATLTRTLEGIGLPFEVVVVDNGSTDTTPAIMAGLCAADPRWKFIRLSRNFGYQNSITAGMTAASGDAIMVIDADLQDPPELIPQFVAKWLEGYDVVYGVREKRTGESRLRVVPTMAAMRFITWMSDEVKLPLNSSDFRLITRRVRDAYAQMGEKTRYVRGMIHWLGFKQVGIPYVRRGRELGSSKIDLCYLVNFMFNAVFNFSVKPLRLFSLMGMGLIGLTAVLGAAYLGAWAFSTPPTGVTTILMLLLINLGVMSLGIGVLGEYISKVYAEVKGRPLWLVDYALNLDPPALGRVDPMLTAQSVEPPTQAA
jgi:polyisoprenyl-phosphate glycosyltransferase